MLGKAVDIIAFPSFSETAIPPKSGTIKFAPVMPAPASMYFFRKFLPATAVSSSAVKSLETPNLS